jgi:hypothetical protein
VNKPTPQAVSGFLGKGFTRSTSHATRVKGYPLFSSGFSVQKSLEPPERDDYVTVEHVVGDRGRYMTSERRREVMAEHLAEYQEYLEQRYEVDLNERKDALIVRLKSCS